MLFGIQIGFLLTAGATLFGALVGATLPEWMRRNKRRENLRIALQTEIQGYSWLEEQDQFTDTKYFPRILNNTLSPQSRDVYEANVGDIGLLSTSEVRYVVNFYSVIEILEAETVSKQEWISDLEELDDERLPEETRKSIRRNARNMGGTDDLLELIELANEARKDALRELNKNL